MPIYKSYAIMIDWCLFIDKMYFHGHLSFWKFFSQWSNGSKINFEKT